MLEGIRLISKEGKERTIENLVKDSTPDIDFYILTFLSVLMATFGLISNSESVTIASMLLAPIMSPILALSLGFVSKTPKLIGRSVKTLSKVTMISIAISFATTILFSVVTYEINPTILSRAQPNLIHFIVAILAGLAVAYSMVKNLSLSLPAAAVAVALVPPLSTVGIGLAHFNMQVFAGAFLMYLTNILGIVFVAIVVFQVLDFSNYKTFINSILNKEKQRLEKEKQTLQEVKEKFSDEVLNQ